MKLGGIEKLSLLDYPKELSCTVFTQGCNFRCPWCHNRDLVYEDLPTFPLQDLFDFLRRRRGKLDAVCITGGEPLLTEEIFGLIEKIKSMGYKVKLDTNGSFPERLKHLMEEELIDFIAMDVKSSPENYFREAGGEVDTNAIMESMETIKKFEGKKEFRTTLAPTLDLDDLNSIAELLGGDQRLVLQEFRIPEGKRLIDPDYPEKRCRKDGLDPRKAARKLSRKLKDVEVRE